MGISFVSKEASDDGEDPRGGIHDYLRGYLRNRDFVVMVVGVD